MVHVGMAELLEAHATDGAFWCGYGKENLAAGLPLVDVYMHHFQSKTQPKKEYFERVPKNPPDMQPFHIWLMHFNSLKCLFILLVEACCQKLNCSVKKADLFQPTQMKIFFSKKQTTTLRN